MIAALGTLLGLVVATLPWGVVAVRRLGGRTGVALVAAAAVVVLLWIAIIAGLTRAPLAALMAAGAVVAAASGTVVVLRAHRPRLTIGRRGRLLEWAGATLGSVVWIATLGIAAIVPGTARVGWVLAGDTYNNIDQARMIVDGGGVGIGSASNPAPLPALLIALLGGADDSIAHNVEVVAVVWSVGIIATSVLAGLCACAFIDPMRPRTRAVVAAVASLLPITVLVGTLPMFWGFMNTAVVTPVILASWMLTVDAPRRPVASLAGNLLLTTVALAGWGPLAAIPAFAAIATAIRFRTTLRELRGVQMALLLAALGQAGAFVVVFAVTMVIGSQDAFTIETIGFPPMWWALVGIVAAIVSVVIAGYRSRRDTAWSAFAWLGGVAAAVAGTVVLARGDLFGYYPVKMVWFVSVALLVVLIATLAGLLDRSRIRPLALLPAVLAVAVTAVLPPALPGAVALRPAPAVPFTGGLWWGGGETERLVGVATRADAPALLWRSGFSDEGIVDYWALLEGGGSLDADPDLRQLSFEPYRAVRAGEQWQGGDAGLLCKPIGRIDGLQIYTADPELSAEVAEACGVDYPPIRLIAGTGEIE